VACFDWVESQIRHIPPFICLSPNGVRTALVFFKIFLLVGFISVHDLRFPSGYFYYLVPNTN